MIDPDEPESRRERLNPYLDAVSGRQPPEIAAFELNLDPYANMLPRVSQRSAEAAAEDGGDDGPRRRHPWLIAISLLLVALLVVLPLAAEVFARLGL